MFYPHRSINDLMRNNSFWSKFVEVGGLTPYNPRVDKRRNINNLRETRCFWEKGKDILHNIQARQTMENEMKRPPDPVQIRTKKLRVQENAQKPILTRTTWKMTMMLR